MEVHHHSHHPKKWKEYITEFLMLFLAVSLGFMAENIREHQIEKQRETQYMESFVADLESDILNIMEGLPRKDARIKAIDTLFQYFNQHPDVTVVPAIIVKKMKRAAYDRTYVRNTTTINQLKNSGNLRLIRNKKVADSIAAYDWRWSRAEYYRETYIANQKDIYHFEEEILEAKDLIGFYIHNDSLSNENSSPKTGFVRIRRSPLNAYLNLLSRQLIVTKVDRENYRKIALMTRELINIIKKEYQIK
ncbi:MAG: hypothetical protein RLZZ546_1464 [Bacteroidota bacterium]|jgi:hypothetical protein